jgi:electron transfer flavoprotein alpha subunit
LAVIPVRDGVLPAGAAETAAECGGRAVVVGSGAEAAAHELVDLTGAGEVRWSDLGSYRPAAWAHAVGAALTDEAVIVLPGSPDGRDLAPRLAAALDRPLFAGAVRFGATSVVCARSGGLTMLTLPTPTAYVATLQVGVRGVDRRQRTEGAPVELTLDAAGSAPGPAPLDATSVELVGPDPATIDLAEAGRIVGGGAGLTGPEQFAQLAALGSAIGASVGATRVITDRGWLSHERQIGTTGVVVAPQLYLAFGVSGAVQHTSGLGHPDHIVSVNTDASCPMMQLADLAVVADANEVLTHLLELLDG